jgi:hypothetical protein
MSQYPRFPTSNLRNTHRINPRSINPVTPFVSARRQDRFIRHRSPPNGTIAQHHHSYNPDATIRPLAPLSNWGHHIRYPQPRLPLPPRVYDNWWDPIDHINPQPTDTRHWFNLSFGQGQLLTARAQHSRHRRDLCTGIQMEITRHEHEEVENELQDLRSRRQHLSQRMLEGPRSM